MFRFFRFPDLADKPIKRKLEDKTTKKWQTNMTDMTKQRNKNDKKMTRKLHVFSFFGGSALDQTQIRQKITVAQDDTRRQMRNDKIR